MTTYYARTDYVYMGGDATFSISFPYIKSEHIHVIVNGDEENPINNFEFLTSTQIRINDTLTAGDSVSIRRITPLANRFVVFTDNNILDEESQNLSALQVFNVVQEIKDNNDELISKMMEFTTLKESVDNALAAIDRAKDTSISALQLNTETKALLEDIERTYEKLKSEGANCNVTHDLFDIKITDRILEGTEAQGWAGQGSTFSGDDYPGAYEKILNEYLTGTRRFYTSDNGVVTSRHYEGSFSGDFYLDAYSAIAVDTPIYTDGYCNVRKGIITAVRDVTSDKYKLSDNTVFYTVSGVVLAEGVPIYSDYTRDTLLGFIEGVNTAGVTKYKGSVIGNFYLKSTHTLYEGKILYSDATLTTEAGRVTKKGKKTVSKYKVSGANEYFYVPVNTNIAAGVTVYSDVNCTQSLGTITTKGVITSTQSYYWSAPSYGSLGNMAAWTANFYTKTNTTGTLLEMYYDSACTQIMAGRSFQFMGNGMGILRYNSVNIICQGCSIISTTAQSSTNYISLSGSDDKLTYYKAADIEIDYIRIDPDFRTHESQTDNVPNEPYGEDNTYEILEVTESNVIKISDKDYLTYQLVEQTGSKDIRVDNGVWESVISYGLISTEGIVFEYKVASNGHEIITAEYESQMRDYYYEENPENFNPESFYVLDTENNAVKLPVIDENKNVYFCVGNTILNKAGYMGVSKAELDERLESYLKNDSNTLAEISRVITEINDRENNILNADGILRACEVQAVAAQQAANIADSKASEAKAAKEAMDIQHYETFSEISTTLGMHILNDELGYNRVKELYHSTFDSTKFTVVGSPTITTDGIATIGNGNGIKTPTFTGGNNIVIKGQLVYGSIVGSDGIFLTANYHSIRATVRQNKIQFIVGSSTLTTAVTVSADISVQQNDIIDFVLKIENNVISCKAKVNNGDWVTSVSSDTSSLGNDYSNITRVDVGLQSGNYYFLGQTDLKQLSVTINGVEVFSGNKTGTDVIRADNFSITGSLTVTGDALVSGFTTNNYITGSFDEVTPQNSIRYKGGGFTTTVNNTWKSLFTIVYDNNLANMIVTLDMNTSQGTVNLAYKNLSNGQTSGIICSINNISIAVNDYIEAEVTGTDSDTVLKVYVNGTEYSTSAAGSSIFMGQSFSAVRIGKGNNYKWGEGSIDLKTFVLYVDDELIYTPCTLLPYTESSAGDKIVDVRYRNLVSDIYSEKGNASYYTIDEENQNYTMPPGIPCYVCVYERNPDYAHLISTYRSEDGSYWYRKYSDGYIEQGGFLEPEQLPVTGWIQLCLPLECDGWDNDNEGGEHQLTRNYHVNITYYGINDDIANLHHTNLRHVNPWGFSFSPPSNVQSMTWEAKGFVYEEEEGEEEGESGEG